VPAFKLGIAGGLSVRGWMSGWIAFGPDDAQPQPAVGSKTKKPVKAAY